ncbi:hypothetical protein CF326_g2818 [Tilletia indica]|nr:hypothetical protein CF326_g2818 [Tilletia indica]
MLSAPYVWRSVLCLALVLLVGLQATGAELEPRASTTSKTARTTVTCSTVYGTKSRRSVSTTVKTRTVTSLGRDVTRTTTPTVTVTPASVTRISTLVRTSTSTSTVPARTNTATFLRTAEITVRSIDWVVIESTVTSTRTILDYTATYIPTPSAFMPILQPRLLKRSEKEAEEQDSVLAKRNLIGGGSFEDLHHGRRAPRHYPRSVECLKKLVYYTHNTISVTARTPFTVTVPASTLFSTATSTAIRTIFSTPAPVTTTTTDWTTIWSTKVEQSTDYQTQTYVTNTIIPMPGGPTRHRACGTPLNYLDTHPGSNGDKPVQVYNRGWNGPLLSTRVTAQTMIDCCEHCHSNDGCMASAFQRNGADADIQALGGRCIILLDTQARTCSADMTTPIQAGFYSSASNISVTDMSLILSNGQCGRMSYGGPEASKPKE